MVFAEVDNSIFGNIDTDNVNYSEAEKINIKAMRLSKLQKWILANVKKLPYDDFKQIQFNGFSPREYFFLSRRSIMDGFFSDFYTPKAFKLGNTTFKSGRIISNGKPLKPINKTKKRSAEVVLTRSLEAMEEHGLIIRIGSRKIPLIGYYAVKANQECKTNEEALKEIKNLSRTELEKITLCVVKVEDERVKTQGIFLTDRGIELRKKLTS